MGNIFKHAPKELAMDAFFAWLFEELHTNRSLVEYQADFLKALNITGIPSPWKNLDVKRQVNNTDLIVKIDGKCILFENKTSSTIHESKGFRNQLHKYKCENKCDFYIYMKLAFIDYEEEKLAKSEGYKIVNAEDIKKALSPLICCQIVEQFYEYLMAIYIETKKNLFAEMKKGGSFCKAYGKHTVQKKFLDDLYRELDDKPLKNMFLSYNSSTGGKPWTHLRIAITIAKYGKKNEYIYWRIESISGKHCIRLIQYSKIDKKYEVAKKSELARLKGIFKTLVGSSKYSKLKTTKVTNKGTYSSEIGRFCCEDNSYTDLSKLLIDFSKDFVSKY